MSDKRILLADDDAALSALLRAILEPYATLTVARDGIEAMTFFRQALEDGLPFSAVCLDVLMPGMDGHRTLRALRRLENTHAPASYRPARIVVISALNSRSDVLRAVEAGCDAYLAKPFEAASVLERLAELGVVELKNAA